MSQRAGSGGGAKIEVELRSRLRELETLHRLANDVAATPNLPTLYGHALDAVVAASGADRASLLLFDDDGIIRFKAWRSLSDAYRARAEGHCPWEPGTPSPRPRTVEDVYADPDLVDLHDVFKSEGIGALVFIPLSHDGRVIGKFMAYYPEAHAFAPPELQLLEAIGSHISVALQRQRNVEALLESRQELADVNARLEHAVASRTAELSKANDDLRDARDLFARLFDAGPLAAVVTQVDDGLILNCNSAWARFFGREREEMLGRSALELQLYREDTTREEIMDELRRERRVRNREIVINACGMARHVLFASELVDYGDELAALTVFVDITERKRAEREVKNLAKALTLAEQRERRRLSQVLHDDLQQILYGVEMRLHLLCEEVTPHDVASAESLQQSIADIREMLSRAIHVTRTLSVELNPPVLAGEDLAASLEWLVRHMCEQHHLDVDLSVHRGIVDLDVELRVLLIQIVRELLFNVANHAGVQNARVEAEQDGQTLRLSVEDAGRGFDIERLRADGDRGLGLFGIEERIRLFGGEIEVRSRAEHGTRVTVRVSLDRSQQAQGVT